MKIILLTPNFRKGIGFLGLDHFVNPSIGLGIMASILINKGHDVVIKDPFVEGLSIKEMVNYIIESRVNLIGLSVVSMNYNNAKELARTVKNRNGDIKIVVGGPHFYSDIDSIMSNNNFFDFACVGEGDYLIDKLIDHNFCINELSEIEGLVYRKQNEIIINPMNVCKDLDKLPFPAYHIYPRSLTYYKPAINNYKRLPSATMTTSRGCPSQCIFCQGAIFSKKIRMNSSEYIIKHIKFLISNYGIKDILFFDDVFTLNKKRLYEICNLMVKEKIKISWACFIKANRLVDEEMLKKMKEAGCWLVMPGVESGSPEILKLLRKGISLSEIKRICNLTHRLGIQNRPSFMLGNPGETSQTLKKTFNFALSLPVNQIGVAYFTPLPGTPIWKEINKYGSFDYSDTDNIFLTTSKPSFIPNDLKFKELDHKMNELYFKFYFRISIILRNIGFLVNIHEVKKFSRGIIIFLRLLSNSALSLFKKKFH